MKAVVTTVSKSTLILFISAVMAAVLLMSMLLIGTQTVAWFKSHTVVEHPGEFSNFITLVDYSLDGKSWVTVDATKPIPVTLDTLDDIRVRVTYKSAHHTAYLRVSLFGGFHNQNTGTYLPLTADCWSFSKGESNKWMTSGDYLYYTQLLDTPASSDTLILDTLQVNMTKPANISNHQAYSGELYIIVDAVQPNRYTQLWGIDRLPWMAE